MTEPKRLKIFKKFNGRCAYCDVKLHYKCNITIDRSGLYKTNCDCNTECFEVEHVIPKSRGGTSKNSNLLPSCVNCNREKGSKTLHEWIDSIPNRIRDLKKETKYLKGKEQFLINRFLKNE